MSTENETPKPKTLADFKGTVSEVRKAKSDFISKYGFAEYETLITNSSITVKN